MSLPCLHRLHFWVEAKAIYVHVTMDKQNHCINNKQAKLTIDAHRQKYLNSFCNNWLFFFTATCGQHRVTTGRRLTGRKEQNKNLQPKKVCVKIPRRLYIEFCP